VTSTLISPFDDATITGVSKAIGELYSGSELTRVLAAAKLVDADGEGPTKWKRLHNAVAAHQNRYRNGKAAIALINEAMLPARTLDRVERARVTRDAVGRRLGYWRRGRCYASRCACRRICALPQRSVHHRREEDERDGSRTQQHDCADGGVRVVVHEHHGGHSGH
jgi:hypothetical protein